MARRMFEKKIGPLSPFRIRFFVKSLSLIKKKLHEIKIFPIPLEIF